MVATPISRGTLLSSLIPSTSGQAVTFEFTARQLSALANVTATSLKALVAPAAAPTGTVSFRDNGVALTTVPLDVIGQASYTAVWSYPGNHTITASYNGDSNTAPSSVSWNQEVDAVAVPTLSGWMCCCWLYCSVRRRCGRRRFGFGFDSGAELRWQRPKRALSLRRKMRRHGVADLSVRLALPGQ